MKVENRKDLPGLASQAIKIRIDHNLFNMKQALYIAELLAELNNIN